MSREKLTAALLEKRDARAHAIWQEVEQQASRYRQAAQERCAGRRQAAEDRHAAKLSQQRDRLDNRTGKRLRRVRLLAEATFSAQLRQLAFAQLTILAAADRADALQQLAAELPELEWQQITVHPDDRQQAAQLFPGCSIATDPAQLGGVIAVTADAAICINNSLTRRLEQAWPRLCGRLLDTLQLTEVIDDAHLTA